MVSIHDAAGIEQLRSRFRIDPERIRQLRNAWYKHHRSAEIALGAIPEFAEEVKFHSLELHSRHDSQIDGATKLLFRTESSQLLETVILRIASGRTSLCVSSQVGCAAKCEFCATGKMGVAINLTRDEILDQVVQANRILQPEGRAVRNVVFMGMGEPFHNSEAVLASIGVLISPTCFGLSPNRVLVSTVGIIPGIARLSERFPDVGLALSLHTARQDERERLIPLARGYPLPALRAALTGRRVMLEVLLLADRTDTDADLAALIEFSHGLDVHINLIPYNPIDDASGLRSSPPERQLVFAETLNAAGFKVTVRHSLGRDISAACGQLARTETIPSLTLRARSE